MRDLARDVDYLDALAPKDREWMTAFLDEYYGATPHGISAPEHIAESNRLRQRMSADLFAVGLRSAGGVADDVAGSVGGPSALDKPQVQALMKRLRELRPEFDETDGRRRARFRSPLAERLFYRLRAQLAALLEGTQ